MNKIYNIRVNKSYAAAIIEDLQKTGALELLEEAPIPDWQKSEVLHTLSTMEKDPQMGIIWDEAMEKIENL